MWRQNLSAFVCIVTASASNAVALGEDVAEALRRFDSQILPQDDDAKRTQQRMLHEDVVARLRAAGAASTEQWRAIESKEDWQHFRQRVREELRRGILYHGEFPEKPESLNVRVSKTIAGDGFEIRNLVFESRPGWWVTANLYAPIGAREGGGAEGNGDGAGARSRERREARPARPGIVIHPSHHNPKTQGELQDMGMTWARAGCYVLVMDQVGHGERRAHPFATDEDYAKSFRRSRQDYYFRYYTGMQLHLAGDSLMGWQVWDLMRGVDLLLAQPGIDKDKIIMIGSVAGGGDPVAVTAALDERITCAVPFNFGGPQPETRYPLPDDAADTFLYSGGGSWESTRNLTGSAGRGYLPWAIVGSIAPRRLIYAHEFAWDRQRDPVWKRLESIYAFYDASENLDYTHGYGLLRQSGSEASHCNNVGPPHRKRIYAAMNKWFDIPVPDEEYRGRRGSSELLSMTDELRRELKPLELHEAAKREATRRLAATQEAHEKSTVQRRKMVAKQWRAILGEGNFTDDLSKLKVEGEKSEKTDGVIVDRFVVRVERDIVVPVLLLRSTAQKTDGDAAQTGRPPVVLMVAQGGKAAFLKHRAEAIAALLEHGVAVCLPDLRGTGETSPGSDRGQGAWATSIATSELMLDSTLIGARLRDLRSVIAALRTRDDVDAARLAVWGDSFAAVNGSDRDLKIPLRVSDQPAIAEPLGGMLALLLPLYEKDVRGVYVRGGLTAFASALDSQFVYLPHDVVVRGAIPAGDLPGLAAVSPVPLRLEALVTGVNQRADQKSLDITYSAARQRRGDQFEVRKTASTPADVTDWMATLLKK